MEIKEATLDNVKDILNLNQELFDYEHDNFDATLDCSWPPNNENYFEESIEKKDSLALVAFVDGRLVGYLIGSVKNAEDYRKIEQLGEIDNMFILPEFRGKKIGLALCDKFLGWAREKGVKRVRVVASVQNEGAIACYMKSGFEDYNLVLERDL